MYNPPHFTVNHLTAPDTKKTETVPPLSQAWYITCLSRDLKDKPILRSLLGTPLVLFRDEAGTPSALLDRCAHRNIPLSMGRRVQGHLECRYHGWQYNIDGQCVRIPGLCGDPLKPPRTVPHYPTKEQNGFIWVYSTPDCVPDSEPYRPPLLDQPDYTTVRRVVETEGSLWYALENALDVPHTAFLHRGLFRGTGQTHKISVKIRRISQGIEAEYIGEPRPEGLAGRILSPSGGIVIHFDRFLLPSIGQVDYRLGTENHFLVTSIYTPIEETRTRLYAIISFRSRFPGWLVKLILTPIGMRIFKQDVEILQAQTNALRRFKGEHYTSTPIDILGLQIARLLRLANAGRPIDEIEDPTREVEMEI